MSSGIGRNLWFCALAATLPSCATTIPAEPRLMVFADGEYEPYARPGSGLITGQVYVRTSAGEIRYGAGSEVVLSPVTTYSSEWWSRAVIGGQVLQPPDERAAPYQRTVRADAEGHFAFDALPPGEYYVVSSVPGELPGRYWSERTGRRVGQRVRMAEGSKVQLVLDDIHDLTAFAQTPGRSASGGSHGSTETEDSAAPPNPFVAPGEQVSVLTVEDRRNTVEDMTRVGLIRSLEQGEVGLVRVLVGESFDYNDARRYYFQRLAGAYYTWARPGRPVLIELWDGSRKIGEYTEDTFYMGEAHRSPR